jgi:sugar phosphate isomerase/epimerase
MMKDSQTAVGDGRLPIPRLFLQLVRMKYAGCVNLEYEIHADDPLPGMQKSFAYMRGVLAGIKVRHKFSRGCMSTTPF